MFVIKNKLKEKIIDSSKSKLQCKINQIDSLLRLSINTPEFTKWHRDTLAALRNISGEKSIQTSKFSQIDFDPFPEETDQVFSEQEINEAFWAGLDRARAILMSMVDELEDFWTVILWKKMDFQS